MARYALPDIYLTATLVNGLPTVIFAPTSYNRKVVGIIVANSVPSTFNAYRSNVNTIPVATTPLGSGNTMRGTINLPAGQSLICQWSAAGTNVRDATARVSFERDDNPLEGGDSGHDWEVIETSSLTLPTTAGPGDPRIVLGSDIPIELQTYYNVGPQTINSVILWYYGNATDTYHYYGVVDLGGGAPPGTVVRGDVLVGTVIPLDTYSGADYLLHRTLSIDPLDPSITIFKNGVSIFDTQAWTPVPTGTMNFGAVGAGDVVGEYTRIGDRYWASAQIIIRAGFAIGDGQISLPVTPAASNVTTLGDASFTDVSAALIYAGVCRRFAAGMRFEYSNVVGASIQNTVIGGAAPFAFAIGDTLRFNSTFYV